MNFFNKGKQTLPKCSIEDNANSAGTFAFLLYSKKKKKKIFAQCHLKDSESNKRFFTFYLFSFLQKSMERQIFFFFSTIRCF